MISLIQNSSLFRGQTKKIDPVIRLKSLLAERGYNLFRVSPRRRRKRCTNMLIVHPDNPDNPVWLYHRKGQQEIVARSLVSDDGFNKLKSELSEKDLGEIVLKKGATVKFRKTSDDLETWLSSWFSTAS